MATGLPRVLVCAYACEPNRGSEQGAAWNLVRELCAKAHVTLITRGNQVAAIREAAEAEGIEGLQLVAVEGVAWLRPFKSRTLAFHAFYYSWLLAAHRACKALLRTTRFDFGWHLTLSSFYTPTPLTGATPLPFVLGPLGGGVDTAVPDLRYLSRNARVVELIRRLRRRLGASDPWVRRTLRDARVVFVHNEETASCVRGLAPRGAVVLEQHAGCEPVAEAPPPPHSRQFDLLFSGRHVEWKGLALAIHALARIRSAGFPATMAVAGSGPGTDACKGLASRLGLAEAVRFTGWLAQDEMEALYRDSRLLIHPALHDDSPLAVAEAMSFGVVPIVIDAGGPPLIVGEAGVVVADDDRIRGLAHAAEDLLRDNSRLDEMSKGAIERAREDLAWDVRAERMLRATLSALAAGSEA